MRWQFPSISTVAACLALVAPSARAATADTPNYAATQPASAAVAQPTSTVPTDTVAAPAAASTPVEQIATGKGFLFHPSEPLAGKFRIGVGGLYDAVDPAVMYGLTLRVPRVTVDARYGLGSGWSLKGHFDSMFVTNELLLGAAYAWHSGPWSAEASMSFGLLLGKLQQLGFDALLISPQYRPELTVGFDLTEDVTLSLRGSVLLMGPEQARVGEVWGGLDNSHAFVGHSEMLYVENVTTRGHVWYFALGAMTTRAYYQLWLMFPDAPGLYTYARTMVGYEF
jgi:hypothetical protein